MNGLLAVGIVPLLPDDARESDPKGGPSCCLFVIRFWYGENVSVAQEDGVADDALMIYLVAIGATATDPTA